MGIRGLTTFIQNRAHLYMEKYELHDSKVVIDGNSIACQLYKYHCSSNDCFGGDYDKFAKVITNFFKILSECNVTPYVIFDGGYESRKMKTVMSRMKNKIKSAELLNSATEGSISVFPLFLRETFLDITLKLNIKCVRCDFEGDTEIANIARALKCPVISYDSDFFIFDVLYIPFPTVEINLRKKRGSKNYSYISCEVYKVEKFLNSFGGMSKSNLPILAVLLGNDYVKRSAFSLFYDHLKIQKGHGNEQQRLIKSLIVWLQNETVESSIKKVLSRYKHNKRKLISAKIQKAIQGYSYGDSVYLKYLEVNICNSDISIINVESIAQEVDSEDIEENSEEDNDEDLSKYDSSSEDDFIVEHETAVICNKLNWQNVSEIFLDNFRKCLYPPCFMDILLDNKYYCIPQVENSSLEYSHAVSSEILIAIHKILTNSNVKLTCIGRHGCACIKRYVLSSCDNDMPSFEEIQNMEVDSRKLLFLRIIEIDDGFVNVCLRYFPEDWHLFIITLKYMADKLIITWTLIYALLLCAIFLNYVDSKVGVYRSVKVIDKKFGNVISDIDNKTDDSADLNITIMESFKNISYNDSLICLKRLVSYFQIDIKMRTSNRLFDRSLIHSMAQFQSCFLHIKYLNNLLNLPFPNFLISNFFNGTFVYNLATNFMKRGNLDDYINILLRDSISVRHSLKLITGKLREIIGNENMRSKPSKRRKKKKKHKEVIEMQPEERPIEDEFSFDPNNKFSVLFDV